jgi:hypothetical protein
VQAPASRPAAASLGDSVRGLALAMKQRHKTTTVWESSAGLSIRHIRTSR